MKPDKNPPINLPFQEPAYGYFEGMEDRTMRKIREAGVSTTSDRNWLNKFNLRIAGTAVAAILACWYLLPTQSPITIDQVNESELVQYLSQDADIHELASIDPQLIHPSTLPATLPTPADSELEEWIDVSTFDQIQEL